MSLDQDSLDSLRIDRSARPAGRSAGPWLAVLAVLLLGSGAGAWWLLREQPVEVTIATAEAAPAAGSESRATVLDASGYVVARRAATVSSKVTGKIADVLIEEGIRGRPDRRAARR